MMRLLLICGIAAVVMSFYSCKKSNPVSKIEDPVVAQVSDYRLYQSDLEKILSPGQSSSDSLAISNAYIEKWIREQLWSKQAEKNIKASAEIDQLVNSYKSSLLTIAYENQLLEEALDSTVSELDYQQVYEEYKSQFVLDEMILNGWFAKIPKSITKQSAFFSSWKKNDKEACAKICQSKGAECMLLDEGVWVKRSELYKFIENKFINSSEIKSLTNYRKSDKTFNYYLKYRAFEDKNELPPLEFIKEELKRVVIHKRKEKIIADLTEELYEDGIQSNQIQVFNNRIQ
jgi:hypothetical protein